VHTNDILQKYVLLTLSLDVIFLLNWEWATEANLRKISSKSIHIAEIHCKAAVYALPPDDDRSFIMTRNPPNHPDHNQNLNTSFLDMSNSYTKVFQNPFNKRTQRYQQSRMGGVICRSTDLCVMSLELT